MKNFLFLSALATIILSTSECNSKKSTTEILRGRLEIKGICYNYTIQLLEGNVDTSLFSINWIDEQTGNFYSNVFGLSDPCTFPTSINQGDEFDFIIDMAASAPCMVCQAYYPKPPRSLKIKVLKK